MGEKRFRFPPMSDRAVYLGGGIWWQLTERQAKSGQFKGLPERIRPWSRP